MDSKIDIFHVWLLLLNIMGTLKIFLQVITNFSFLLLYNIPECEYISLFFYTVPRPSAFDFLKISFIMIYLVVVFFVFISLCVHRAFGICGLISSFFFG